MRFSKKQLTLPLLLTVVVLSAIIYSVSQKGQTQNDSFWEIINRDFKSAPSNSKVDVPKEFSDDGVYENYTYGFHLKYPEEIFDVQKPSTGPENYKSVSAPWYFWKRMESSNSSYPISMEIYVYKYVDNDKEKPGYGPTLFFDVFKKQNGETVSQYDSKNKKFVPVGVKISSLDAKDVSGVFYQYEEKFEDGRLGTEVYSADWLKDDKIFVVRLIAPNKTKLVEYRKLFEGVIESFKFIASIN